MTKSRFYNLVYNVLKFVKSMTPYDTGNLRENAVRLVKIDDNTLKIYVEVPVAPYMPYTNEPWISPKWHGRKNPNEHWWNDTADNVARFIAEETKGKLL